jgi:hypothetical protein
MSFTTCFIVMIGGALGRAAVNMTASVIRCIGAVTVDHLIASRLNGAATAVAQTITEEKG